MITKDQACVVLREVGKALAYLHAAGVVHLDIKGENVLIKRGTSQSSPAQVKLIDFNLSTKLDEDGFTRYESSLFRLRNHPRRRIAQPPNIRVFEMFARCVLQLNHLFLKHFNFY